MNFEIIHFREYVKNTLQGFLSVKFLDFLGGAIEIRDITVHLKDKRRWLNMPSRQYEEEGQKKWSYIIVVHPWGNWQTIQSQILKKLDEMKSKVAMDGKVYNEKAVEDIPF